jgi:hypothetical protein
MGWTVRGLNPGGGEIFCTCPDRPWGPPSLLYSGYRVFPGGKERPGRTLTPHPLLVLLVMIEQSYTSTPPMSCMACTEPQCLYKGALYILPYSVTHVWDLHPPLSHLVSDCNTEGLANQTASIAPYLVCIILTINSPPCYNTLLYVPLYS